MSQPYRPPAVSKASASTLCQKCLKRGHYSYECRAGPQDRPYAARPSRTQQLLNPKLAPKLSSDVPNDLLKKKGAADEQLARNEAERGRKRSLERDEQMTSPRKRPRSISSVSSSDYSSSPGPRCHSLRPTSTAFRRGDAERLPYQRRERKRRRSRTPSSRGSYSPDSEDGRNTRRRMRSHSPPQRGRRRSRSGSHDRRGPYSSRSRSASRSRPTHRRPSRSPAIPFNSEYRQQNRRTSPDKHDRAVKERMPLTEYKMTNGHRGAAGSAQKPVEYARKRSLSPYSKRLALTQAMNGGR